MANHLGLSKDKKALKAIEAADRLLNKINQLQIDYLAISEYNKKYFGNYTANPLPYLQRFSYILLTNILMIIFDKFFLQKTGYQK